MTFADIALLAAAAVLFAAYVFARAARGGREGGGNGSVHGCEGDGGGDGGGD